MAYSSTVTGRSFHRGRVQANRGGRTFQHNIDQLWVWITGLGHGINDLAPLMIYCLSEMMYFALLKKVKEPLLLFVTFFI
jgi:hypothetical protein